MALNRLSSTRAALLNKETKMDKSARKARTTTLIQVGTLVKMVGLLEPCCIEEGMDLQLDMENRDRAAVLLGILMDTAERVSDFISDEQIEEWREKGIQRMKQQQAYRYYLN